MYKILAIALLCVPALGGVAYAEDGAFRGAKTAYISFPRLTEEQKTCGLTEKDIKIATKLPLSFTSLKIVEDEDDSDFLIAIDLFTFKSRLGESCVTTVWTSANARLSNKTKIWLWGSNRRASIRLYEAMHLHIVNHPGAVIDAIEDLLKLIIIEYNNDNK